ncbi:MAG: serine/threonine-protein kinase [Planctomycetaceae bacterium]
MSGRGGRADRDGGALLGPLPAGFEIVGCEAAGTRSEVWRVRRVADGAPFAWKRLRPELLHDRQSRRALQREARVLRRACNPFVAKLERDFADGDPPWLLLEWLEGGPLGSDPRRAGKRPVSRAIWCARQIVQGLQALARAGFAHGTLAPKHVFLTTDGGVRLLGLGDAIPLTETRRASNRLAVKGIVEYLAPEALRDGPFDAVAADVYSLGVLLFRMLSGRLPFTGENADDILRLHRQAPPPPLIKYCPQLSADEIGIVTTMLRKEPLRRPRLSELLGRLLEWELRWFGLSAAA